MKHQIARCKLFMMLIVFIVLPAGCSVEKDGSEFLPCVQPENVGVSSDSLRIITNQIKAWTASGDIVGAEVLIIKNKKKILHETFGWMDCDKQVPLKKNTIFNIRSMTKPFVGTAILMLYEQGNLSLDDRVSRYIPSFDNEKCRNVTIDHLLSHTAGFISSEEKSIKHKNLEEVVGESAKSGPIFEPGSRVYYSGRNSAILAYIIQTITDTPAEEWIKRNILDPLKMKDTFCVHNKIASEKMCDRISHVYVLTNGVYTEHWDPAWPPEFSYFGGGVGFYSTALDYAKFLASWMAWEDTGTELFRDLSTVKLAFKPNFHDPTLARHWNIFNPSSDPGNELPAFGHIGDFGTMAYAVPESDLIICFLTQSRYNKILGHFYNLAARTIH